MNKAQKAAPKKHSHSAFQNKQFIIIFVIAFFIYMSSTMFSQTLPKYADDLGVTAQSVGLLAGVFQLMALSLRPVAGQIVDNEDRLRMLRIVLSMILISIIGFIFAKDYWTLVFFRAVHGLAWGVGSTLFMTIATGCFTMETMTAGIGLYGLGQTMAQAIAPTIALPIAQKIGYSNLYIGNLALIAICLGLTLFMQIDSPRPPTRKYSYNLKGMIYSPAILPAAMTLCNAIAKSSIQAFLVIFAGMLDIVNIGIYFTVQAVVILVARSFWSKLADRYGSLKMLIPCEILLVLALSIISFAHTLPMFLLGAVLMGLGTAGEQPILMSESVKSAPPEKRGSASNTSYVGTDIGGFLGSYLAGIIVAAFGYRPMFRLITLPMLIFTVIYVVLYRWKHNPIETEML